MYSFVRLIIAFLIISYPCYSQTFTEINPNIQGVNQGNVQWGDYDNDGDLDAFVIGSYDFENQAKLYQNNEGVFNEVYAGTFMGMFSADCDWGDYDNDGDLDIIISGSSDTSPNGTSVIYNNSGSGFNQVYAGQINGFRGAAVQWGDFDSDGDLDLAIGGEAAGSETNNPRNAEIYKNTGSGFELIYQEIYTGINNGTVDWGDYDNDGDLDLLMTGASFENSTYRTTHIVDNTPTGFVKNESIELIGVSGSCQWGDYDNDGDLDILLCGSTYENSELDYNTYIYKNNNGTFESVFEGNIIGTTEGEAEWGDYDNDGDLDILVVGRSSLDFSQFEAKIYQFNGTNYTVLEDLTGVRIASCAWGDYENDGDLDILLAGQDESSNTFTSIFYNNSGSNTYSVNTPPSAPANLTASVDINTVTLKWDPSTDEQTAQEGLTYNIYLKSASDTLITPQSRNNGQRKVVKRGNMGFETGFTFKVNEPGDYEWGVQALDKTYEGSAFSSSSVFHINYPPEITNTVDFTTPEDTPLRISVEDLTVVDPDNSFPDDYTLTVNEGINYSLNGNNIVPDHDFYGELTVPMIINDGTHDSPVYETTVSVTPVNDYPIITGLATKLETTEESPLLIELNDLIVTDVDNDYPSDFTLTITAGEDYVVNGNTITPKQGVLGEIFVVLSVNDGELNSGIYLASVNVTELVTSIDEKLLNSDQVSISPNPTQGYLHIDMENQFQGLAEIEISNLSGEKVMVKTINLSDKESLDVSQLKAGVYLLNINTVDKRYIEKVIIK